MSISVLQTLDGVEGTQEIELYLWVVAAWAAGMACSGGSTASRGWWRGRYGGGGVPAGLRWVGRGSGRRREVGDARGRWARAAGLWAATLTAAVLGDVGLARWGEQGMAAAPGADQETKCLGEGRRRKEIYGGDLLSWVKPRHGTKGPFIPDGRNR